MFTNIIILNHMVRTYKQGVVPASRQVDDICFKFKFMIINLSIIREDIMIINLLLIVKDHVHVFQNY